MDAALFLEQFGHLADSPNGVSKLRNLILELAVHGQLVPQNPDDEPASELLKRIETEKKRLVKAGELKPSKLLPPITEDEVPYALPDGWMWVRVNEVGHDWGQKKPDRLFNYIDVGAIDQQHGVVSNPTILTPGEAPSRARKIVKCGTVIYATVRPYLLNIAVITDDYEPEPIASTAFAIIHPYDGIIAPYIYYYLRCPVFVVLVEAEMKGMAYPAINDGKFFSLPFPLPPLAEQERIVAKVDELMALCDQLESELRIRDDLRQQSAKSSLFHLTDTASRLDAHGYWQSIEAHFPKLFDRTATVADLRATILQLAVQGRLVPQNPDDEPASELLKRIEAEKKRLIKAGELKPSKPLAPITEDEVPYALPDGWMWVRLEAIYRDSVYGTSEKASELQTDGIPVYGMGHIQNGQIVDRNFKYLPKTSDAIPKLYLKQYDLLFNRTNSYELVGKTAIFIGESDTRTFASYLIRFSLLLKFTNPHYINYYMNSPVFRVTQIEPEITQQTNQANFNGTKLGNTLVPFSPLHEQERIVAKVDELMALCDQLEAAIETGQALSGQLFDSILHHLFEGAAG